MSEASLRGSGSTDPPGRSMRGRVLAIDGDLAIVRSERCDARVPAHPGWRPGDLVDGDAVVRAFGGGDYPGPSTEVARLPRPRLANLAARATALDALRRFFAERDELADGVNSPFVENGKGFRGGPDRFDRQRIEKLC